MPPKPTGRDPYPPPAAQGGTSDGRDSAQAPGRAATCSRRRRPSVSWAGYTQAELALALDVTDGIVSAWESGTRAPTPRNLVALARELGLPPIELVNLSEEQLRLADLRALYGLSSAEAARRIGVSATTLYDMEQGDQRPQARALVQLGSLYDVSKKVVERAWERSHSARLAVVRRQHPDIS